MENYLLECEIVGGKVSVDLKSTSTSAEGGDGDSQNVSKGEITVRPLVVYSKSDDIEFEKSFGVLFKEKSGEPFKVSGKIEKIDLVGETNSQSLNLDPSKFDFYKILSTRFSKVILRLEKDKKTVIGFKVKF